MSAELFINKLEELGLFEEKLVNKLRARVAKPGKTPSASSIAKYLIDKGQLTEVQAKKLLAESKQSARQIKRKKKSQSLDLALPMPDEIEEIEELDDDGGEVEVIEMEITDLGPGSPETDLEAPESVDAVDLLASDKEQEEAVEAVYDDVPENQRQSKSFKGKKDGTNQWGSKWVMILPAVLIIISLLGGLLYWVMTGENADQRWAAAESAYGSENYVTSLDLHEEFKGRYKDDARSKIAAARVRMARIRIPFTAKNWEKTLETCQGELQDLASDLALIEDTSEQSNIRSELAGLLPENAQGFVDTADNEPSIVEAKRLLKLAEENMKLVNSGANIPKSLREQPVIKKKIDKLMESTSRVRRKVDREDELVAGLEKIRAMSEQGDTQDAAQLYDGLLKVYPELRTEERLLTAIRDLSKKLQTLVRNIEVSLSVSNRPAESDSIPVVLATRVGKDIEGLTSVIRPLLIKGAVYGIDVGAGRVAWRHFVGYQTQIEPQLVDLDQPMVLVGDLSANELRALDPDSGRLIWRTKIGEEFYSPLLIEEQIFVSTKSGKIIQVEAIDGASGRAAQIPQPFACEAAPFVSSGRKRLLQLGDKTNLYMMSATDLSCREAYFLGHDRGAIEVPPLVLSQHILIAENRPNRRSNLHVLKIGEDGLLRLAQNGFAMGGHVHSPIKLYGRRAMVITDRGEIRLFEIDVSNPSSVLKLVAETQLKLNRELTTRYIPQEGSLWVADRGLTRFDIQTQKGKLARQTVKNGQDEFIGPLQMFPDQNALLHVRRRRGSSLISVAAVDGETLAEFWRLDFGAPLAGGPFVEQDSQNLVAANLQGDLFALENDAIEARFAGKPIRRASTAEQDLNFPYQVDLGDGTYAFVGDSSQKRILYFKPGRVRPFEMIDMSGFDYQLAGRPTSVGKQVLIASREGMVQLIDPAAPKSALKFLPEKEADSVFDWQTAAPIDDSTFVLADRQGVLYMIKKDGRALRRVEQVKHPQKFVRPPTVIDGHVAIVTSDGRKHSVTTFELPEMVRTHDLGLKSSATFGPYAINETQAIVGTDSGQVLCFDSTATEIWSMELETGSITGATVDGENIALVTIEGDIFWVSASDGSIVKPLSMGEPTVPDSTFPTVHDGKLFVGTADGTVHVTEVD